MKPDQIVQNLHILRSCYRSNVHFLHITNFDQFKRSSTVAKTTTVQKEKTKRAMEMGEWITSILISQIVISNKEVVEIREIPFAFTE